jgi:hypothetical protein
MTTPKHADEDGVVAASELAAFAFCPRAWQLRYVAGVKPDRERLPRGAAAHGIHAARVFRTRRLLVTATVLALLALAGLAGAWFALGGRP